MTIKYSCIDNGIVKWDTGNEEYIFWTYSDYIKPYIIKFLKERFPGRSVVRELNNIDLSIPEENLPVEIQATPVSKTRYNRPHYSEFEQKIEKGINQNIVYGVCWLFFDSELLRAMKNAGKKMSINMDWFRKLMKEGKLKVFTVSHEGIIEEKQYSDFDFLAEVSQTCKIAAETDGAILNKNKMKIYINVEKMYDFTQSEIDKFYDDWREYCNQTVGHKINKIYSTDRNDQFRIFLKKQKDDRGKLYGNILDAIGNLPAINDILWLKNYNRDNRHTKYHASLLGIFDTEGVTNNVITRFVNRPNICQYFPGYMGNKEKWDYLKESNMKLNSRQFDAIVTGKTNPLDWRDIVDGGWNANVKSEQTNQLISKSIDSNDKNVEFKIEDKDKIITINVKDKTKQKNIEDVWG